MAFMRVSWAERQVVNAIRDAQTRHLLIQLLDTKLEEMDEATKQMARDNSLGDDEFQELWGNHQVDKALLEMLKGDVEHVDNGT